MSCQINTIGSLIDVEAVKRYLFPAHYHIDDENDPWTWPKEDVQKTNGKDLAWLHECNISLSPTGQLLVLAHQEVMIVLTSKWDSQEDQTKYHITWHGSPCQESNEYITSVLCLPLISQGKSSHGAPDWTCIVVGFSSGFIRFYAENCNLLISEMLHNEPVTSLKCQSYEPPKYTTTQEHTEELYVVFKNVICVFMGFGLFQTLRACRNQLARVQANCGDMLRVPPLVYKKWAFNEHDKVEDVEVFGPATANMFDHFATASLHGGFSASYRSSAPQATLMLATGSKPYFSFQYAMEGEPSPIFDAKAVANFVKSAIGQAIPSWIRSSKKATLTEKEKIPIEPADSMVCRFALCDHKRNGYKVVMSPSKTLSVVSDSLGRVILIDNLKGVAIRMWKGFRDAQCGWLEVKEDSEKLGRKAVGQVQHPRTALFLVIYAPKIGVIEIWAMQQGPKVAAFKASKGGRLLYTGHGLMGLNNIPLRGGNSSQYPCLFMDPEGNLREISVPFHFALSDKNSKRARDLHLLKKLKVFLKEEEYDDERLIEQVQKTMEDLKTTEIKLQAVEMLSCSRYIIPNALQVAVNVCIEKLAAQDPESLDHASKTLLYMSYQLQKLISFYKFVHKQHDIPPLYNTVVADDQNNSQALSSLLHAAEKEVNGLLKLVATIDFVSTKTPVSAEQRVTFREDGKTAFVEFLSCFELGSSVGQHNEDSSLKLKKSITEDKLNRISELVYQGTLYSDTKVEDWKTAAAESAIDPAHLMQMAINFWLQKKEGAAIEAEMLRFTELLKVICSLADVDVICPGYNELSSWWREVHNMLMESTNPFMALTGAIVCRAVAHHVEKEKERKSQKKENSALITENGNSVSQPQESSTTSPEDDTFSSTSEWENFSRDMCQWSVLIGQLEDVAILDAVIRSAPPGIEKEGEQTMRKRLYHRHYDKPTVSLSYILNKGKGSVCELVARWLSSAGLDPCQLVDLSDVEFDNMEQAYNKNEENNFRKSTSVDIKEGQKINLETGVEIGAANEQEMQVLDNLSMLKRHFPYSLSSSILLGNMCWEFMLTWHQNVDNLEALEAAVSCLQTIPSPHLREGICNLMWTMHLRQRFEGAAKLFQKVGKVPKEWLCRKEIGISDLEMCAFLETCTTFLDTFMEASLASEAPSQIDTSRYEELWNSEVTGPPPLSELALAQPKVNTDLLHLRYQLSLTLHMIAAFSLRFAKPISSLFGNVGHSALFAELTSKPQLPSHNPDPALITSRSQFLFHVISGAMQTIQRVEWDNGNDNDKQQARLDTKTAVQWMSKCYCLASVWHVNSDILRSHQICELYSYGYDRLAEEIMPAVHDPSQLCSKLLVIAGQRLKQIITTCEDMCEKMSYLSPSLSAWLDSLNPEDLKSSGTSGLGDLLQLLAVITPHLSEESQEHLLAQHMMDAVQAFLDS